MKNKTLNDTSNLDAITSREHLTLFIYIFDRPPYPDFRDFSILLVYYVVNRSRWVARLL